MFILANKTQPTLITLHIAEGTWTNRFDNKTSTTEKSKPNQTKAISSMIESTLKLLHLFTSQRPRTLSPITFHLFPLVSDFDCHSNLCSFFLVFVYLSDIIDWLFKAAQFSVDLRSKSICLRKSSEISS